MAVTVHDLIKFVETELDKIESRDSTESTYRTPEFPMLIVYLGKDSKSGHNELSENLFRLWPAFRNDLRFIGIEKTSSDFECESIETSNPVSSSALDKGDIGKYISQLFSDKTHFNDLSGFVVYYVLDTSSIANRKEFESWLSVIDEFNKAMDVNPNNVNNILFVLLDGGVTHREAYDDIREVLSEMADESLPDCPVRNTMIVGRYLSDSTYLSDWTENYHVVACAIALSNDGDSEISHPFFSYPVVAPYYVRVGKDSGVISQIIVDEFLKVLSSDMKTESTYYSLERIDDLDNKLGRNPQGTIALVDKIVRKLVDSIFPSYDQMMLFPVSERGKMYDYRELTSEKFDKITMGGWSAFLDDLEKEAVQRIKTLGIEESYANHLKAKFNNQEIYCLNENINELVQRIKNVKESSCSDVFFEQNKENVVRSICKNEEIINLLKNAVENACQNAKDLDGTWHTLFDSRNEIHHSKKDVLMPLYGQILKTYYDSHKDTILSCFNNCQTESEIMHCFEEQMLQFLHNEPMFRVPLAVALGMALGEKGHSNSPSQFVLKQFETGKIYFSPLSIPTTTAGPPAVIMDTDQKKLYDELKDELKNNVVFYDTDVTSSIEYLKLFELKKDHIRYQKRGKKDDF